MDLSTYKFPEVTNADLAFPTFDTPKELVEEAEKRNPQKGMKKFSELFYSGGKIELKKDGIEKPFTYTFKDIPYFSQHIEHVLAFEDFNFDGEKEIVISGDNGIYIYDRKTGKEKNLFEKTAGYGKGVKVVDVKNFINTHRGEYEINESEKTIKISGSCGAGCGSEETYKGFGDGTLKLIRKCEWDN